MKDSGLSVIICTLDRAQHLGNCLKALEEQTIAPEHYEVIIVDNGSRDATAEVAAHFCGRNSHFIYMREETRGLAVARNAGVERSAFDVVAFTDDDAIPTANWVARLRDRFVEFPEEVAVVGGEVLPIFETERPAWLNDALLRPLSAGLMWSTVPRFLRPGEWLVEVNCAYRKRHLLAFGGFPVHLGRVGDNLLSGEGSVNVVMERAGLRQFYDPSILVQHYIPASRMTRSWFRRRSYWQGVTMNLVHKYIEETSAKLGVADPSPQKRNWEEIIVPVSPQGWADLFDDRSETSFEHQLYMLEQIGYMLQSQSVVIGR